MLDFLQALTNPIFKLVEILMKAAPIGAFGAMAFTIGKYGIGSVVNLAMLVGTFYLTALLFVVRRARRRRLAGTASRSSS